MARAMLFTLSLLVALASSAVAQEPEDAAPSIIESLADVGERLRNLIADEIDVHRRRLEALPKEDRAAATVAHQERIQTLHALERALGTGQQLVASAALPSRDDLERFFNALDRVGPGARPPLVRALRAVQRAARYTVLRRPELFPDVDVDGSIERRLRQLAERIWVDAPPGHAPPAHAP